MTSRRPANDAFEAGLILADALARHNVSYCLGGALALGQYAIPRATIDVDVNVFLEPGRLAPVFAALHDLAIEVDQNHAIAEAEAKGLFIVYLDGFRVDVFTPSIDYSWQAERTMRHFTVEGRTVCFLSPEALCVFKLLFFRSKDLADLERLIAVMGKDLDVDSVRAAIVEMMGNDDPRTTTWDRLVADFAPS
jgi:hypothetical protein